MRQTQRMPASTTRRTSTPLRLELVLAHARRRTPWSARRRSRAPEGGAGSWMSGSSAKLAVKRRLLRASLREVDLLLDGVAEGRASPLRARPGAATARARSSAAADDSRIDAIELHLLDDVGPAHLDRDRARRSARSDGAVHLRDRRRGDRLAIELGEQRLEGAAELALDGRAHGRERERRHAIRSARQLADQRPRAAGRRASRRSARP